MNTILSAAPAGAQDFVEQIKNFGLANWILIGSLIIVVILLIVLVSVNMKIMKKYRLDLKKTRVARIVTRVEIIDGWCCAVVENRGQEMATNVKVKAKGSIMKYYYAYINRCRVDDTFGKFLGKGFTLVAGDRKQVRLFPISSIATTDTVLSNKAKVIAPDGDVNLIGHEEPSDEIDVVQNMDADDAKILKSFGKKEEKLAKLKRKQDEKLRKEEDRVNVKRQKALAKENKKQGKATHTSVISQPDMSPILGKNNILFSLEYESLGYLMKNKYEFKNIDFRDFPEELKTNQSLLAAQNALLEQVVFLQQQIRTVLGEVNNTDKI